MFCVNCGFPLDNRIQNQSNQQVNYDKPQSGTGSLKYCSNCHKPVRPDYKYCSWCGSKIPEETEPVQDNQENQAGQSAQSTPASTSADIPGSPIQKKTGKKWIGIVCIACIALAALIGGFWFLNSSDNTSDTYIAGIYFTYSPMPVREDTDRESEQIDFVKDGSVVYLGKVITTDDGEVWGELDSNGSGKWICIQDAARNYLELIDYESNTNTESGVYFLCCEMPVRATPGRDGDYITTVYAGHRVYIANTQKVDLYDSLWGELDREGSGRWICLQEDRTVYLRKYVSALDPSNSESINGYLPGTYYLTQNMNVYDTASTNGSVLEPKTAGSIVKVGSLWEDVETGWIWGELDESGSGKWIGINTPDNWFFLEPIVIKEDS